MKAERDIAGTVLTSVALICCILLCGAIAFITDSQLSLSRIDQSSWFMSTALSFGEKMKGAVDAIHFENERTGLIIKALLTGEKSGIPNDVTQAFRNIGASHILALSGLHLGIIYAIVRFITRLSGNSRKAKYLRSAVIIFICGFYTLATGAGPSIVRAFIFITIGECARLSGRSATLKRILMISVLIHLSITPSAIKEVSFQLSYAAIAGIAYIFPWLQGFWPGDRHEDAVLTRCARWIWDSAAMSISCQITTGPLAYLYFGTFPQYFLLTNLIAVPLAGLIIPAALLVAALTAAGGCPAFLISVTEWLVTALTDSLSIIASM
jgi:competence protein ComEC